MGKLKEKRQAKKEAKAQKKAQKQANKQAKKDAKLAKKDAKTQKILAKANKKNAAAEVKQAKAQAIADGTWENPMKTFLGGVSDTVGSIFGGGGADVEYTEEYVPENMIGGNTANPNSVQGENKSKTGLYVGIGGGILALILLIVGLKK